jgi:hypothetical protein
VNAIHILSAVLALEAQALALGAPVQHHIEATQAAICQHMETLADSVRPPPPPPPVPVDEEDEEVAEERESLPASAWDPEPHDAFMDASRCRALLLEVIRRSAHDWVLYRNTRKPERIYAMEAHTWLFEEEPGHPWWELRQRDGEPFLSFLSVCETLDLDPETVRARVRSMTIRDIATAGRPAERRRPRKERPGVEDFESPLQLDVVSLDDPSFDSSYEAHFAVG